MQVTGLNFWDRRSGPTGIAGAVERNRFRYFPVEVRGHEWRRQVDRQQKEKLVASLNGIFGSINLLVVTRPNGLTVAESTDLRRQMGAEGATFRVTKNRLTRLALKGTNFESLSEMFVGPTAIAFSNDPVAAARVAVKFAKANAKLEILGGVLFKDLLDAAAVKFLAELPSLDELRASIIAMVNTPATRIAQVLQAPGSQVARVLNAYSIRDEAA
jgi:large subunit ribosomal protein L10